MPRTFIPFAAKAAAESREKRREREENEQEDEPAAASGDEKSRSDGGQSSSEDEGGDEGDQSERTTDVVAPLVRAKPDQGNAKLREMDEQAVAAETENTKKKKYLSLRERKRKERAALRAQKEEESEFINGTGTTARFGEVAEAPPTITLKRKSGGKGEKAVPIELSGHKIVEIAAENQSGKSNRQSKIFADLLSAAKASSGKSKKKLENQGLDFQRRTLKY